MFRRMGKGSGYLSDGQTVIGSAWRCARGRQSCLRGPKSTLSPWKRIDQCPVGASAIPKALLLFPSSSSSFLLITCLNGGHADTQPRLFVLALLPCIPDPSPPRHWRNRLRRYTADKQRMAWLRPRAWTRKIVSASAHLLQRTWKLTARSAVREISKKENAVSHGDGVFLCFTTSTKRFLSPPTSVASAGCSLEGDRRYVSKIII